MDNGIILGRWEEVVPSLPDDSIKLVVIDPPYGCTPHLWDKRPYWSFFMTEMARLCGDEGQMWIFVRMPWSIEVHMAAIAAGWRYVQERIWQKQNGSGTTVRTFRKIHENIWHFKRPKATTFNLQSIREPKASVGDKSIKAGKGYASVQYMSRKTAYADDGMRLPKSVVFCPNLHQSTESLGHPTQKPEAVIRPLILYSSNPGDFVLDPCCGTGTTLKVARDVGRRWIGIEKMTEWHQKAKGRLCLPTQDLVAIGGVKGTDGLSGEE